MPLADVALTSPQADKLTQNPAAIYLSRLAKTGRRAMMGQLKWVAGVVGAENGCTIASAVKYPDESLTGSI
jgi:hypothetical protein